MEEKENQELEEKVEILKQKILQEEDKKKIAQYTIKVEILMSRIEQNRRLKELHESKLSIRPQIYALKTKISEIKRELRMNADYDIQSPKFIFTQEDIKKTGINKYIQELINSGKPEQIEVAQKIRENINRRLELEKANKELKEKQNNLKSINKTLKKQNYNIWEEGKFLVERKNSRNILTTISNGFSTIINVFNGTRNGIKIIWSQIKENRRIHKEEIKDLQDMQSRHINEQNNMEKELDKDIKKAQEKFEENKGKEESIYTTLKQGTQAIHDKNRNNRNNEWKKQYVNNITEKINKNTSPNMHTEDNQNNNETIGVNEEGINDLIEKYEKEINKQTNGTSMQINSER